MAAVDGGSCRQFVDNSRLALGSSRKRPRRQGHSRAYADAHRHPCPNTPTTRNAYSTAYGDAHARADAAAADVRGRHGRAGPVDTVAAVLPARAELHPNAYGQRDAGIGHPARKRNLGADPDSAHEGDACSRSAGA